MRRVVSLFLPTWSTDRVRRKSGSAAPPAETPLVLIGREGRRRVVLAADAAARRAGLRPGIPVTKAQALVPGLIVNNADPVGDAEALDRLALWALRLYAPIVAADPPDGLVIDTTGAAHLHGGEDAMLEAMIARFAASGFTAHVAIADSWSAAYAFARYAVRPIFVVPPGESATAILDLPIAALRLPRDMVESLRVLGFNSIGELADKPRAPLTLRFGPELGRCLDQVMGQISEPIDPIRPPISLRCARFLASPSPQPRRSLAIQASSSSSCARCWRPKALAPNASICFFTGSTTASKRSALARLCRCAM